MDVHEIKIEHTEHLAPDVQIHLGRQPWSGKWQVSLGGAVSLSWTAAAPRAGETPRAAGRRVALSEMRRRKLMIEEQLGKVESAISALRGELTAEPAPWDAPVLRETSQV